MNPAPVRLPGPPAACARRRLLAVVLLLGAWLAAGIGLAAPQAAAHAELTSSDPAAGSHLDAAPAQLTLRFSEGVSLIDNGFRLLGADATPHPLGGASTAGSEVVVPVPGPLPDGAYILVYRVVSADTHPIAGSVPFSVGAVPQDASAAGEVGDAAARIVAEQTAVDGTVRTLWALDRWAGFAGVVLLLGVPAFALLCWPGGSADPALRGLAAAGGAVVVVSALGSLPLQAAYATGASVPDAFGDGSIRDLMSRSAGQAAAGRAVLAVALLVLLALAARLRSRALVTAAGVAAAALLLSFSWAGHPAVGEYPALTMADDSLHLAAAAVWVGGLVCLCARVLRGPVPGLHDVLRRWSTTAMTAVAVLVVTGSVQAWRELQSVQALVDTAYGRWVLVKVAGLTLLVALGNLGRRRVRRLLAAHAGPPAAPATERVGASLGAMLADPTPRELAALRRSVLAEVAISAAVLAATAVLVVTTPGRVDPAAAAAESHGEHLDHGQHDRPAATAPAPGPATASVDLPNQVKVEVSVDPATAGTPRTEITVRTLSGAVVDPPEIRATAALPAAGIEAIPLQLIRSEPGRYVAEGARLPFPGEWRITVTVRTTDVDSGVGTVSVHLQ